MRFCFVIYANRAHYSRFRVLESTILEHEPDSKIVRIGQNAELEKGRHYIHDFAKDTLTEILNQFEQGEEYVIQIGADEALFQPLDVIRELYEDRECDDEADRRYWREPECPNIILHSHVNHPCDIRGYWRTGMINASESVWHNTEETKKAIRWLLSHDLNVINLANAEFVDQIYTSALPFIIPNVKILRNDSFNVAFYNLHERELTTKDGTFYVNGEPLVAFHFTGYQIESANVKLSKYAPDIEVSGALKELLSWYYRELKSVESS